MEEDKEIDMLQQDIQQLINRCIILNKDELTATAREMFGRDIVLRFRKLLQENKRLKTENDELRIKNNSRLVGRYAEVRLEEIIRDKYISKDKLKEILGNKFVVIYSGNTEFPDHATKINKVKYINAKDLQELLEGDE